MERKLQELANETEALVRCAAAAVLTVGGANAERVLAQVADAWAACAAANAASIARAAPAGPLAQHAGQQALVAQLLEVLKALKVLVATLPGEQEPMMSQQQQQQWARLQQGVPVVHVCARQLGEALASADPSATSVGRFEWVDGALTRAIERGQWVLLDNANLCNPTVLDRLNPLLEPHGVGEHGGRCCAWRLPFVLLSGTCI